MQICFMQHLSLDGIISHLSDCRGLLALLWPLSPAPKAICLHLLRNSVRPPHSHEILRVKLILLILNTNATNKEPNLQFSQKDKGGN